jgi:hypothetical protein
LLCGFFFATFLALAAARAGQLDALARRTTLFAATLLRAALTFTDLAAFFVDPGLALFKLRGKSLQALFFYAACCFLRAAAYLV